MTAPAPTDLAPALADLGLQADALGGTGPGGEGSLLVAVDPAALPSVAELEGRLARGGTLLVFVGGAPDDALLAGVRDGLWPTFHVGVLYDFTASGVRRRTLQGSAVLEGTGGARGTLLVARRTAEVLAPEPTVEKFDLNAAGWAGKQGSPGWPHYRWMRRHVALFAPLPSGGRILDFGCGAGWCGIEAARRAKAALCSFDPSPEMVRIAQQNAQREGVSRFTGRVGFGDDPPFPAPGEDPFDLVISSGVISFAPDAERLLDGLASCVRPGGTLLVGDIQRESRGFRGRRRTHPLLPVRELNAKTHDEVRSALESRGFVHRRSGAYQLTRPVPQLMHLNETRLGGALTHPLLWTNQLAAAVDRLLGSPFPGGFDSWVMWLERRA